METVDAAADGVAPTGATLASELIARAAAIGAGRPRAASAAFLPRDLRAALRACEVRARRLADGLGQGAALDFLGDAIVAIAVDHSFEPGEARAAVIAAAQKLGMSPEAAAFVVFRRALASKELAQLPPAVAAELTQWTPNTPLHAVVCSHSALANLPARERARVIAVLQSATRDGGVHLVQTIAAGSSAIEELRVTYHGWAISVEPTTGEGQVFLARKEQALDRVSH